MRALAVLGVVLAMGCGPDLFEAQPRSFLVLARQQAPPSADRTEGVVHFRGLLVPHAQVTVLLHNGVRLASVTDQLGRFSLDTPSRFVSRVFARADELIGVADSGGSADSLDVELIVPWRVSGTVRDADGVPVAGAEVMGEDWVRTCMGGYPRPSIERVTTDADGWFFLELMHPYSWIAASSGGGRGGIEQVNLFGAGWSVKQDLRLEEKPDFTFARLDPQFDRTIDLNSEEFLARPWTSEDAKPIDVAFRPVTQWGAPVEGVQVGPGQLSRGEAAVIRVDVSWAPMLLVQRRGFVTVLRDFTPNGDTVSVGEVVLKPARDLTVTVIDQNGAPISGCSFWAGGVGVTTDASGTAWLAVAEGDVDLEPSRCCRGERVSIPGDLATTTLQLERDAETCDPGPVG